MLVVLLKWDKPLTFNHIVVVTWATLREGSGGNLARMDKL